jgi:hypothetical protein
LVKRVINEQSQFEEITFWKSPQQNATYGVYKIKKVQANSELLVIDTTTDVQFYFNCLNKQFKHKGTQNIVFNNEYASHLDNTYCKNIKPTVVNKVDYQISPKINRSPGANAAIR